MNLKYLLNHYRTKKGGVIKLMNKPHNTESYRKKNVRHILTYSHSLPRSTHHLLVNESSKDKKTKGSGTRLSSMKKLKYNF
jgi:hypothetical protein